MELLTWIVLHFDLLQQAADSSQTGRSCRAGQKAGQTRRDMYGAAAPDKSRDITPALTGLSCSHQTTEVSQTGAAGQARQGQAGQTRQNKFKDMQLMAPSVCSHR